MFVIHSLFTAFDMAQLRAPVHLVHLLSFAIAVLILATILSKSQARYCGNLCSLSDKIVLYIINVQCLLWNCQYHRLLCGVYRAGSVLSTIQSLCKVR